MKRYEDLDGEMMQFGTGDAASALDKESVFMVPGELCTRAALSFDS